jgi:hypothetical protein
VDIVLKREGQDEDLSDFVVAPYFPKVSLNKLLAGGRELVGVNWRQ